MSDILQISDSRKAFFLDPKTWISVAVAFFTAGSAVALMEQGQAEHLQTTYRIEQGTQGHAQVMKESLEKLIEEIAVTRRIQEETLDVLRVMCVMNAQTKDVQRSCISRR